MDTSPWSKVKSELYALIGRNPRSNRSIAAIVSIEPGDAVLDIGCGPGAAVRAAASVAKRSVGVDRSAPMIAIAQRRSRTHENCSFEVGAAEALPFPDAAFDVVWTIHSFHHWEDPDRGLAEVLRVLRPGGRFVIVESESKGSHGLDRRQAEDLSRRLQAAGFSQARVSNPGRELVVAATSPDAA